MAEKKKVQEPDLPYDQVAMDTQLKILNDLVAVYGKEKKPLKAADIQSLSAAFGKIPSTLKYFAEINWLSRDKNGKYVPSQDLIMYFTGIDKENPRKNLVKILFESEVVDKLVLFLNQKQRATREDLINYLGKIFKLPKTREKKIQRLIDLLILTFVIKEENNELELIEKTSIPTETSLEVANTNFVKMREKETSPALEAITVKGTIPISISILINPDTDEDKIKNCIRIVLEELKGQIDDKE